MDNIDEENEDKHTALVVLKFEKESLSIKFLLFMKGYSNQTHAKKLSISNNKIILNVKLNFIIKDPLWYDIYYNLKNV